MSADRGAAQDRLEAFLSVRLTVRDLQAATAFFVQGLGLKAAGPPLRVPLSDMRAMGLQGSGLRQELKAGATRLELEAFERPGRPYPADSDARDLVFQHFALVVADAALAYARALRHGARPITREGPATLPAEAGGVTAAKLRDPEGRPFELLQFAASSMRGPRPPAGPGQIDHSAISVRDLEASQRFYADLGLTKEQGSLNHGPAQARLDNLEAPLVDVAPLRAAAPGPHLELLRYRAPPPRSGPLLAPNDLAATRIVWRARRLGLLRDPDGHLHLLLPDAANAAAP